MGGAVSDVHEIKLDLTRPLVEDRAGGHNRFHPRLEPVLIVEPGDKLELDVRDGIDCQVSPETDHADLLEFDMLRGHPMTGPIEVKGAEAGDLLDIEILRVDTDNFGSTPVVPGFGMLGDLVTNAYVVRWEIDGNLARSDDLPGISIPGRPFLGVIGLAPAADSARLYAKRESDVASRGAVVLGPDATSAVPAEGGVATGLRTIPPRENGGNLDLKQAGIGATVSIPVQVPGGLLSIGDPHSVHLSTPSTRANRGTTHLGPATSDFSRSLPASGCGRETGSSSRPSGGLRQPRGPWRPAAAPSARPASGADGPSG